MKDQFGKLCEITIRGYRSIRVLDALPMDDINILIGPNGAGKSNFISLFRLLRHLAEEKLQEFVSVGGSSANLLYFGPKTTSELALKLRTDANIYEASLAPTTEGGLTFTREVVGFMGTNKAIHGPQQLESNMRRTRSAGRIPPYIYGAFENWRVYHFHDTGPFAPLRSTTSLADMELLAADGGNLPAFLYFLQERHPEVLQEIEDLVGRIAPFFSRFVLRPDPLKPDQIRLRWRHRRVDGDVMDVAALSDGTLRFIALATLMLQPEPPSTVVVDEPELGLHPSALGLLASIIHSVAHQVQVICSTQSATFADQFSWSDLIVADCVDDESRFRRLAETDVAAWLDEFSLGEIWEKNLIGGQP